MGKNIDEIEAIELAIVIEEEGSKFYSAYAQKETASDIREVFLKLASDEQEHIKILERLGNEISKNKFSSYEDKYMISDFLKETIKKGIFSFKGRSAGLIKQVTSAARALKVGIEAEKESINFYSQLSKKINSKSAVKVFNSLTEIEMGHLKILEERLANLQFAA